MTFPATRHSALEALRTGDEPVRRQAYEAIIGAYWRPAHEYVRHRWHYSEDDCADLTQAFFSSILDSGALTRYDPEKGTFRTYLRVCLDRFVINAHERESRCKSIPLPPETAAPSQSPEDLFHREWVRSLFSQAIDDLRSTSDNLRFSVFEAYDLSETDERCTYAELAVRFGTTPEQITNYLAGMRRGLRRALLNRLRIVTATEREFRLEARRILGLE